MDNIPLETILIGLAALAGILVLLHFGRVLARWALILGGLAAAIILGLALLEHSRATRQAMQATTVAATGATLATVAMVVLALLLLVAVGIGGYCYLRWRLTERWLARGGDGGWLPGPNAYWGRRRGQRRRLPRRPRSLPVVYVVEDEPDDEDEDEDEGGDALEVLHNVDLSRWGW